MTQIAYITYGQAGIETLLPLECPYHSWFHEENQPLPENAIVLEEIDFNALMDSYSQAILLEKDRVTMLNRAAVLNDLLAQMGAENKERLRTGEWTTQDLIDFLNSDECMKVQKDLQNLSFELAQGSVMAITNPKVSMDMKLKWVGLLNEHLYL